MCFNSTETDGQKAINFKNRLHEHARTGKDICGLRKLLQDCKNLICKSEADVINVNKINNFNTDFLVDEKGNTALHVALICRQWTVARLLVQEASASLTVLNGDAMMPVSYVVDGDGEIIFDTLTRISVSAGLLNVSTLSQMDANGVTLLHVAARYCRKSELLETLISAASPETLTLRNRNGGTFLNEAASVGNVAVLEALRKFEESKDIELSENVLRRLLAGSKQQLKPFSVAGRSPVLDALLGAVNRTDFFDCVVDMYRRYPDESSVSLKVVMEKLLEDSSSTEDIRDEMGDEYFFKFAEHLPTYIALHAGKYDLFHLMVEKLRIMSVNQWDPKYKRTCLHWAIWFNKPNIVKRLLNSDNINGRPSPYIQDADGRTPLHMAFEMEQGGLEMADLLRSGYAFEEYEEKLLRDRAIYAQALNAILVGAALIANVAFAGWLQLPSNNLRTYDMKVFWWSNSVSFYSAVAAMCVTIGALLPTPAKYTGFIVSQLRLAVILVAGLLAVSVAAFTCAFSAAGFAVLSEGSESDDYHPLLQYRKVWASVCAGGGLCVLTLFIFIFQLLDCVPTLPDVLMVMLPFSRPSTCMEYPCFRYIRKLLLRVGESSRRRYVVTEVETIREAMKKDIVASLTGWPSASPHLSRMKQSLNWSS